MPSKRHPITRHRKAPISAEAVALFRELELGPQRGQAFEDKSHQLARLLNLTDQYWTCNSVLDRSHGPCHPPGYTAHKDWHRCRAVRLALLTPWPVAPTVSA